MVSPFWAVVRIDRRVPAELSSAALVTIKILGRVRSSRTSNRSAEHRALSERPVGAFSQQRRSLGSRREFKWYFRCHLAGVHDLSLGRVDTQPNAIQVV